MQWGNGPVQNKIRQDPNYIPNEFPLLDKFTECTVEVETPDKPEEEVEEDGEGEGEELEAVKEAATDDAKERNTNAMGRAQALKGRAQALKGRAEAKLKGAVADLKSKSWSDVVNMEINEMMLLGALLSGMIVLVLVVVSTKRKKKKKKHKQ